LAVGSLWGLFFVPPDYLQGDAFRIIYIHVPAAFTSLSLYSFMGMLAIILLIWRIKIAGIILFQAAEIGAAMTFIALITGSIWGKPMWGTWWIWDARLTSELILLLFYLAILAVKNAYKNKDNGEKIVAILTLVGLIDLPIIHYSVVWWNTLHQGSTISFFAKPKIELVMAYPLFIMIIGFIFYSFLLIIIKSRNELLIRERNQSWVSSVL
ncbi:MAG: heme ABC transporter permease, partial [Legionellales bacterium RIFCSPHIGHO2_12_FULL_35_11]